MTKSFGALYAKWESTPEYLAEQMAVKFLAELGAAMKDKGISNAELARRIGTSPAYITKLFRGPSNLSVETIAKLSVAVGLRAQLNLDVEVRAERWFSVFSTPRQSSRAHDFDHEYFNDMLTRMKPSAQDAPNDEKFALAA